MSLDIDTPPAGTAGQLGVLPRCQRHVLLSVELHQLFQHDGAGGHVDTQRQGLGRENSPDQAGSEQLLDGVTECGQHPRVVGGQTAQQPLAPLVVAQHRQIVVGQFAAAVLDDLGDPYPLLLSGQPQRRTQALLDGGVAPGAGEHEGDGRQQPGGVQGCDHVRPGQRAEKARTPTSSRGPASCGAPRLPVRHAVGLAAMGDVPQQVGVDVCFVGATVGL